MYFSEKDREAMQPLFRLIHSHPASSFQITMKDDTQILCTYDTMYETENELEDDDPNYEEFCACLFKIEKILYCRPECKEKYAGKLYLEVTYHNFPSKIIPLSQFEQQ